MYTYFVSYAHSNGFGHVVLGWESQVTTPNDVVQLNRHVADYLGYEVSLINFQLLSNAAA